MNKRRKIIWIKRDDGLPKNLNVLPNKILPKRVILLAENFFVNSKNFGPLCWRLSSFVPSANLSPSFRSCTTVHVILKRVRDVPT